jgi:pteridine reductase
MKLTGKTALVTGGALRMGRAICEALSREGCGVVIHCRSSVREADVLQQEFAARGSRAWTIQGDLATEQGCFAVMDQSWARVGAIDFLINNAAVFQRRRLAEVEEAAVLDEFRINLLAPLFLTREFAARTRTGAIVNLLDRRVAGHAVEAVPYALSKKALEELTYLTAIELAPGIRVNGVAPGAILPPAGETGAAMKQNAAQTLLKSNPRPEEVADAVIFALKADSMTGQILYVDGGRHLFGST